jgi:hypothetical protein
MPSYIFYVTTHEAVIDSVFCTRWEAAETMKKILSRKYSNDNYKIRYDNHGQIHKIESPPVPYNWRHPFYVLAALIVIGILGAHAISYLFNLLAGGV